MPNSIYRFSPIKTEEQLITAVRYIYSASKGLISKVANNNYLPVSVTVFTHYPDEFKQLNDLLSVLGNKTSRFHDLHSPLELDDGQKITKLRIREPDPYRMQVGCADFDGKLEQFKHLRREYPDNIRLIERSGQAMVEVHDPDTDVLAYIVKPLMDKTDDKKSTKLTEVKLFTDGGSRGNPGPSASGYVLLDQNDKILKKEGIFLGTTTNNQAEYRSLKFGLEAAKELGARKIDVFMDSMLVINQLKGIYKVKNKDLWPIYSDIKELCKEFSSVSFSHVPRELNKLADGMVNQALDAKTAS